VVSIARPALVGIEVPDATVAAARDVIGVAVKDAIEVEALDVAGAGATDVGSPVAAAGVADESRVLGGFVVGLAASEVVVEAGLDESRVEWGAAAVELGEPRVVRAAFEVVRGESVAGLDGFQVGQDDYPDEL
jgi:hypothetical protein